MIRIGISWGRVQIGSNRCFHLGFDHHKRALGDGMRRAGIQFGMVYDDVDDVRGIHIAPYIYGPSRQRTQAVIAAIIAVASFIVFMGVVL